jgi:hypothetical protein
MKSARNLNLSRPFHGLICKCRLAPSTKVLGYCHLVRSADATNSDFLGKGAPDLDVSREELNLFSLWRQSHHLLEREAYLFQQANGTLIVRAYHGRDSFQL